MKPTVITCAIALVVTIVVAGCTKQVHSSSPPTSTDAYRTIEPFPASAPAMLSPTHGGVIALEGLRNDDESQHLFRPTSSGWADLGEAGFDGKVPVAYGVPVGDQLIVVTEACDHPSDDSSAGPDCIGGIVQAISIDADTGKVAVGPAVLPVDAIDLTSWGIQSAAASDDGVSVVFTSFDSGEKKTSELARDLTWSAPADGTSPIALACGDGTVLTTAELADLAARLGDVITACSDTTVVAGSAYSPSVMARRADPSVRRDLPVPGGLTRERVVIGDHVLELTAGLNVPDDATVPVPRESTLISYGMDSTTTPDVPVRYLNRSSTLTVDTDRALLDMGSDGWLALRP